MRKLLTSIVIVLLLACWVYAGPNISSPGGLGGDNESLIDRLIGQHAADDNASEKATRTDVFITPDGLTHFRAYVKMLTASANFTSGYVAYADGNLVLTGSEDFAWDGNILTVNGGIFLGGKTYLIAHVDNVLSIRNAANPGGYRWYYNYVSASDYDYGYLSIDADNVTIGQDSNGTSQDNKNLVLKPGGTGVIKNPGGSFQVTADGNVTAARYSTTREAADSVSDNKYQVMTLYEDADDGDHFTTVRPSKGASPTITLPATTGTLATLTGTETLTNKTLTTPIIGVVGSSLTASRAYYFGASGLALAKGDNSTTMPAMCVSNSTTFCVTHGQVTLGSAVAGCTRGKIAYVSAGSAGVITCAIPAVSTNQVQRIGVFNGASDDNVTMMVMPSLDVITVP